MPAGESVKNESTRVPFNIPFLTGREAAYVHDALESREHAGNRSYARRCLDLLEKRYGLDNVFLTGSCTTAMEMGALLAGIEPGDEVILPSYTFSSTANAVLLRGAIPVFCEVDPATMNIDVERIEELITPRTRMLLPIDYAGIPCEIERIGRIARRHELIVMLDGAQSFHSRYRGQFVGRSADLTAFSFHETKNVSCGEGGALVVNRPEWTERAHCLQEKGTDRRRVLDGLQSKYSWVSLGSSFLLSDLQAAMLLAQLESAEEIVARRALVTAAYRSLFEDFEKAGFVRLPHPPDYTTVNHHAFFVIFDRPAHRRMFLDALAKRDVHPYIGYLPLHSSSMGARLGYTPEDLTATEDLAGRIVRLPLFTELAGQRLDYCLESMATVLKGIYEL